MSNGFTTVENLEVTVSIVPRLIPLQGHNFTVKEGLGVSITTDILNISHPFYNDANIDFVVEEPPRHGDLRYRDGTVQELAYFTWEEVRRGGEESNYFTWGGARSLTTLPGRRRRGRGGTEPNYFTCGGGGGLNYFT